MGCDITPFTILYISSVMLVPEKALLLITGTGKLKFDVLPQYVGGIAGKYDKHSVHAIFIRTRILLCRNTVAGVHMKCCVL